MLRSSRSLITSHIPEDATQSPLVSIVPKALPNYSHITDSSTPAKAKILQAQIQTATFSLRAICQLASDDLRQQPEQVKTGQSSPVQAITESANFNCLPTTIQLAKSEDCKKT
ncbi:hypothetical protein ACLKA7_008810 [Drosophila subpalustris]